jgi:hypothetical protein
METQTNYIEIISSYSGLIPMMAGIFISRKRDFRAFVAFLLIGLLTDLHVTLTQGLELSHLLMSLYSLIDILFLLWFATRIFDISLKKQFICALTVFICWFYAYKMWHPWDVVFHEGSRYFDPIFLTIIAITAGYGLLKIIESPLRLEWQGYFGFYIGIFIYNFCIFFNFLFITEEIAKEFWYLNASFNILTMLIYTWSFLRLRRIQ